MAAPDDVLNLVAEAESAGELSAPAAANIRRWLTEPPFAAYRDRLVEDIQAGKWKVLDDAFYAVLEFGTGGRRGKMYPVGTNVLNARTMAESARGLADYVTRAKGADAPRSCAIARDTRHNSPEFARLCARVLAAAGFKVYLFPDYRSTPLLSFAVRYLKCDCGIMITASHNAPSDNGFKCYAATGGQVIPPDDSGIIACVKEASDREIPEKPTTTRPSRTARSSWSAPRSTTPTPRPSSASRSATARDVSIVYTPMHGVGETSVAAVAAQGGVRQGQRPGLAADPRRRLPQRPRPRLEPRDPQDPRRSPSPRPRPPAPTSSSPATPTPTGSASACPSPATRRASGRPSTATRSASCSPPSS